MCHLSLSWRTICLNGIAWYDFYHSLSSLYFLQKDIFIKYTPLLTMLLICMFFNRRYRKLVRLDGCWDWKEKLQLFVHGHGQNLSHMITTLKVDQMTVSKSKHGWRYGSIRSHNLETCCSLFYHGEYGRYFWVYFLLPSRVWLGPIYLVGVNSNKLGYQS